MANTSSVGNAGCMINFISWNVKSLNHPVKRKKVLLHLDYLKADIAFLQETHLQVADQIRLTGGWIGQTFHSSFNSKTRGLAILVRKNIPFVVSNIDSDPMGRYIIVMGRLYGLPVILVNIYAPNWDDNTFFTHTFSRISNVDTHHLILGGDINCVLSSKLDRSSSKVCPESKSSQTVNHLLQTYGLTDIWRFRNPTSRGYSFFSPVHNSFSQIDYFFIDNKLLHMVVDCEYHSIVISDHAPLKIKLNIPGTDPGYRPWRFNPLLLSDETFVNFIKSEIDLFLSHNKTPGMSFLTIWEALKAYLRGQIISYGSMQRKATVKRLRRLTDDILKLDIIYSHSPSEDILKRRLLLKTKFDLLSTRQAENLLLKSRHVSYEYGERAGKILAHQLRQKTVNQYILEISDEQGQKHVDHMEINSCFRRYYAALYTSEPPDDKSALDKFFRKPGYS